MDINALAAARDAAGVKVEELQNKKSEMAIKLSTDPNIYSDDEIIKITDNLAKAKKARDFAQSALDEARKTAKPQTPVGGNNPGQSEQAVAAKKADEILDKFVSDFKNMVTSGKMPDGTALPSGDSDAGLTIPEDIQTAIHELVRSFNSLESLVNVENVTTVRGTRVYEKLGDITPLHDLDDETAEIGNNDDPALVTIKYLIHRYAGISEITNTLLKDSAENILAWIENWIAKKDVVTRNAKILDVINSGSDGRVPKKASITVFDDIKDLENNTLDPLIEASSIFLTNQSGFNVLSKVKDAEGRYLLQPNPTNPEIKQIDGHPVTVVVDKFLPDISGSHPLYFGDFKMAITLYNYQSMNLLATNIGGGAFEHDTTKIRVIDRFDVELIDDGAYAIGTFKSIKDQTSNVNSITQASGE